MYIQMANPHIKRSTPILSEKKMLIKATRYTTAQLLEQSRSRTEMTPNVFKGIQHQAPFASGNGTQKSPFGRRFGNVLQDQIRFTTQFYNHTRLVFSPKLLKMQVHRRTCAQMFTAASIHISQSINIQESINHCSNLSSDIKSKLAYICILQPCGP